MVTFVTVTCADLERSLGFYLSLGFRELARFPSDNPDGAHLRLDGPVGMDEIMLGAPGGGEVTFMLIGFRTPPVEIAPRRTANTLGMWRAAFIVADLDAAVRELQRARIMMISKPVSMAMGPGLPTLRFVCFRGLDDEVIELIEQPS
jgi:catechol 2,3-dioxygenase-like lactoylglutathione lyase family enzyme